jgi:hypothetical protein
LAPAIEAVIVKRRARLFGIHPKVALRVRFAANASVQALHSIWLFGLKAPTTAKEAMGGFPLDPVNRAIWSDDCFVRIPVIARERVYGNSWHIPGISSARALGASPPYSRRCIEGAKR